MTYGKCGILLVEAFASKTDDAYSRRRLIGASDKLYWNNKREEKYPKDDNSGREAEEFVTILIGDQSIF